MSKPAVLASAPSPLNEALAACVLAVNLGMMAWLLPQSALLWLALGCLTTWVAVFVGTSPAALTEKQRVHLLMLFPVAVLSISAMAVGLGINVRIILPNLMILSCFPLLLISLPAPHRGISWAVLPFLPGLMLNTVFFGSMSNAPFFAFIGLGAFNVLSAAYLAFTSGPALRNPSSVLSGPGLAARIMGASALVAIVVALPVTMARMALEDMEFPSMPGLPSISTSSATVFTARFHDEAPDTPYWEYREAYAWPVSDSKWVTVEELEKGYAGESNEIFVARTGASKKYFDGVEGRRGRLSLEDLMADEMAPVGDDFFTYTLGVNLLAPGIAFLEGTTTMDLRGDSSSASWEDRTAFKQYRSAPYWGLSPALDVLYLSIPEAPTHWPEEVDLSGVSRMPKTHALVSSWVDEGLAGQALVDRALAHFEDNLAYHFDHQSTDPAKNGVDYFLFEDQKGVCRHFANAFALMMRMGGIPSRLRGGYAGGHFDEDTNTWTVRRRDAHIWTEVWLEDGGWVKVDPTTVVPVEKGVPQSALASHWGFGSARANIIPGGSFSTAGKTGDFSSSPTIGLPSIPPVPGVVVAVLLALALGALAWAGVGRGWFSRTTVPAEDRAWQWALDRLRRQGFDLPASAGPSTVGKIVAPFLPEEQADLWMGVVNDYERWKFGGEQVSRLPERIRKAARHASDRAPKTAR